MADLKSIARQGFPWTAVVILSWIVLIRAFDPSVLYSIQFESDYEKTVYNYVQSTLNVLFNLLLPITGLIADVKLGRINTLMLCSFIGAVSSLVSAVLSFVTGTTNTTNVIILVALPLTLYSRKVFQMVSLTLGTDQLMENSSTSQQLSSYFWWVYWCNTLGIMMTSFTSCIFETHRSYNKYTIVAHFVQLVLMLISALLLKKYIVKYRTNNSLELIFRVLNFAIKNKNPVDRSALTYWEEVEPSRINLGKTKYGGPFQEKDVEIVKTFFRLLPVVAVVTMIQFPYQVIGRFMSGNMSIEQCLLSGTYFVEYCTVLIVVPLHELARRYCSFSVNVSMLKKIGLGIALSIVGKLGYAVIDLYISIPVYETYNETVCLFRNDSESVNEYVENMSIYLFLLPNIINSLGTLFIIPGSLEFVFAQAPHSMQGLLIGLWYGIGGLYETAGYLMIEPFKSLSQYLVPSCELYVFIMNFLFMVACLMLFVKVSQWYKLHNHEDVFNAHHIAENFYEKEFNRREDYYRRYGSILSNNY